MEIIKTVKNTTHFIVPVRDTEWSIEDPHCGMTLFPKDPDPYKGFFKGTLPLWGHPESEGYIAIDFVPKEEAKLVLYESLFAFTNEIIPSNWEDEKYFEEWDGDDLDYINQLLCLAAQISEDCFKKTCEEIESTLNVMIMGDGTLKTYRGNLGTKVLPVVTTLRWEDYLREISYLNSQYIEPCKGILIKPDLGNLNQNILSSLNSYLQQVITYEQRDPLSPQAYPLRDRMGLKDTGEPIDPTLIPTYICINLKAQTWSLGYDDKDDLHNLPGGDPLSDRFAGFVTIPSHLYQRGELYLSLYIL